MFLGLSINIINFSYAGSLTISIFRMMIRNRKVDVDEFIFLLGQTIFLLVS